LENESVADALKKRNVVPWALAYLGGGWLIWQAIGALAVPWSISSVLIRLIGLGLIAGFFVTLVISWFHGEKGRQDITGKELLVLAALLAIWGMLIGLVQG
jgi:adenylate cyclase